MKGSEGIPSLKVVTMNKLISKFPKAPNLFFSNLFPTQNYPTDEIKWEVEYGSTGMTPFVAPGATAPVVGVDGYGEASAKAAFLKEKAYIDEEALNSLRAPGTAEVESAERKIAKLQLKLYNRILRRKEWMWAQMFLNGGFSYTVAGGSRFNVNYGVPANHRITLTGNDAWNVEHVDSNPILDIMDGKEVLIDDGGGSGIEYAICNSTMIKRLMFKESFQNLLKKSAFGEGDLFRNPTKVIGDLLGVGTISVYDEKYEIYGWPTITAPAGQAYVYVDDASNFMVGATLRVYNMEKINIYEDHKITDVDITAGKITLDSVLLRPIVVGQARVRMQKKFIADNQFGMFNTTVDGMKVAEMMQSPYGLPSRYGIFADKKDIWDPEGTWLRIQDKGLPVMYNPDSTFIINAW